MSNDRHKFYGQKSFRTVPFIDKHQVLKKVVMETGIWKSPNTENAKCYGNVFSHEWKQTESTKNKWTESAATLLSDVLLWL